MKVTIENHIHEIRGATPLRVVAHRAGMAESSLHRVIAGEGPGPNIATAFKIAHALDKPIGAVFSACVEADSEG